MHIAVDANCLAWGWSGIPKYIDRITRELVRCEGTKVTLLANASEPFADIPGAREEYKRIRGGSIWRETFVGAWLERHRPDVFWAPETAMPRRLPVPSVVTVHDLAPVFLPHIKPLRHRLAYRTVVRRSVQRATRVIAVSESTAHDLEVLWNIPAGAIRVVGNGIDDRFAPGSRDEATQSVAGRWRVHAPFVLAVGAIEPRKGLDLLVDVAAETSRRGRAWQFVFAGQPGYRGEAVVRAGEATGVCHFLGHVTDEELVSLYRAADVLAVPSLYEGFGVTPLEAMACGTPVVIAGSSGGLEETSGPAAVIVTERTARAWADAIEDASERRGSLAERGFKRARRFRWPAVAADVYSVLQEATSAPR